MKKEKKIIVAIITIIIIIMLATILTFIVVNNNKEKNNSKEKTSKKQDSEEITEMEETYKNYLEAKDDIAKTKDEPTIIYKKDNEYIFIDKNGKEIAREEYEDICANSIKVEVDGEIREIRPVQKDDEYFFIDSRGKKLFDVEEDSENVNEVWGKFSSCIYQKEGEINEKQDEYKNKDKSFKELYLDEKYFPNDKSNKKYIEFEEKQEDEEREISEYYYFKNEELTDKVLQVVMFTEEATDTELKEILKANENSEVNSTFYDYKNEYYLIDPQTKEKIKLDCNNLLFSYEYGEDDYFYDTIMLYSDGSIPYYDDDSTGYFDINTGEKKNFDSNQIIIEVDEKYQYIYNKDEEKYLIKNKNTSEIEKEYEQTNISVFQNFFKLESDKDTIIVDKELNELFISNEEVYIKIYGDIILVTENGGLEENCLYKVEGNKLLEIDQPTSSSNIYTNYLVENESDTEEQSVYNKLGIIDEIK